MQFALKAFGSIKTITAAASVLCVARKETHAHTQLDALLFAHSLSLSVSATEFLAKQVTISGCMHVASGTHNTQRAN
jgi:hypothetical protein